MKNKIQKAPAIHCYVYKGENRDDHYLYLGGEIVPGSDPDIPGALLEMLGELSLVVDFELSEDRWLPQAEARQVMHDLSVQGFYLQMPKKDMLAEEDHYFN